MIEKQGNSAQNRLTNQKVRLIKKRQIECHVTLIQLSDCNPPRTQNSYFMCEHLTIW